MCWQYGFRAIGGTIAGLPFTFGVSIMIGWILGIPWPVNEQVLQTITTVALVVGILALVGHRQSPVAGRHRVHDWFPQASRTVPSTRNDLTSLYRDRQLGRWLRDGFRRVRHEANLLRQHPELEQDVLAKLKRMLPAEGHLTERLTAPVCADFVDTAAQFKGWKLKVPRVPDENFETYTRRVLGIRAPGLKYSISACLRELRIQVGNSQLHDATNDAYSTHMIFQALQHVVACDSSQETTKA